jgi:hypothetical protein
VRSIDVAAAEHTKAITAARYLENANYYGRQQFKLKQIKTIGRREQPRQIKLLEEESSQQINS